MIKMDRDSKWGSMMSCLESVKEYAQELLESDDICFNDYEYFERAIGLIEDYTQGIRKRWEEEEARDKDLHTYGFDIRTCSMDLLRLICDEYQVSHNGTREGMIAGLLE